MIDMSVTEINKILLDYRVYLICTYTKVYITLIVEEGVNPLRKMSMDKVRLRHREFQPISMNVYNTCYTLRKEIGSIVSVLNDIE